MAAVAAGETCRLLAKTFMLTVASVVKWSQRQRAARQSGGAEDGRLQALPCGAREGLGSAADRREGISRCAALLKDLADRGLVVSY